MPSLLDYRGNPLYVENRSTESGLVGEFIQYITALNDENVGPNAAFQISAAYQCINIYAVVISSLKIIVKQGGQNDDEEIITSGTLADIAEYPCGFGGIQNKVLFWDSIIRQLKGRANAYAWIDRTDLNINRLVWLPSGEVQNPISITSDYMVANHTEYGVPQRIPQDRMLHFRENTIYNPLCGISPVKLHREQLAIAASQNKYGRNVYRNGLKLTGVIQTPLKPKKEEVQALEDSISKRYSADTGRNFFTLTGGTEWKNVSPISPIDMDFIRGKEMSRQEIADIWNVPISLLAGTNQGFSYNNLQAMDLRFLKYSLGPTLRGIEAELNQKLGTRRGPRLCFDTKGLLAMSLQDQVRTYNSGVAGGLFTLNQAKKELGLPGVGAEGDKTRMPLNQGVLGEEPADPPVQPVRHLRYSLKTGEFSRG